MHAVIRNYTDKGAPELMDLFEKKKADIEKILRGVKGFVAYSLVRTADGGCSISIYETKAGSDESTEKAHAWIAEHGAGLHPDPPTAIEAEPILILK